MIDAKTESFTIQWPQPFFELGGSCEKVTTSTEVTFVGAKPEDSDTWIKVNSDAHELTLFLDDSKIKNLKADKLVIASVKAYVTDESLGEEIASAELQFTIQLKLPLKEGQEDEEKNVLDKEDSTEESTSTQPEAAAEKTNVVQAQGEEFDATFKTTVVEKAITVPTEIPEPIKVDVQVATETGEIKIAFSRAIKIDFTSQA